MFEISISISHETLSVLSALSANLENVALAIDSSLRIHHQAVMAEASKAQLQQTAEITAFAQPPQQYPQPQYQPPSPPVAPFPQQQQLNPVPVAPPPAFTQDQLAVAGASLMDAGKQQELLALLARFQANSIMSIPKEAYGAFAMELRQLGARI